VNRRAPLLVGLGLGGVAVLLGVVWSTGPGGRGIAFDPQAPEREGVARERAELEGAPDGEPERSAARTARAEERPAAMEGGPASELSAAPFAGLVVDAATREPVPLARVAAGPLAAPVDTHGRFRCEEPLPPGCEHVEVHDPHKGTHIRTVRREALEPSEEDGGWIVPIAIGPTYRFRVGEHTEALGPLRARVVEIAARGRAEPDRAWDWAPLYPHDPPFIRYDNPQTPIYPGGRLLLQVENEDGTRRGECEIAYGIAGVHPEVPLVVLDQVLGLLRGRVVDTLERPLRGARLVLAPADGQRSAADPAGWAKDESEPDGTFAFASLAPGEYWLFVRPRRGEEPVLLRVTVMPGESTVGDVAVQAQEPVGSVEGKVASASGKRLRPALVRLRAVDGRAFDRCEWTSQTIDRLFLEGGVVARGPEPDTFAFPEVPAGDYELSIIPLDGREWSPESVRVSAPAADVVFTCQDAAPRYSVAFEVEDAETGARIDAFYVQFQGEHYWHPEARPSRSGEHGEFSPGARFRWNVFADGYVPAVGTQDAFEGEGERRVARVRLERGFGATLLLRDGQGELGSFGTEDWGTYVRAAEAPPVAGAEVWIDGELAARSGPDGVVRLRREREPQSIEVRAAGWTVLGSEQMRDGRIVGPSREVLVWLMQVD